MNTATNRTRRHVNEVSTGRDSRGRGGGGRGGRGGRHGRGVNRMITLTDGTQIEYHASFNFPREVYLKMKQEDNDTLEVSELHIIRTEVADPAAKFKNCDLKSRNYNRTTLWNATC
jgi:hypothetical protein